MSNALCLFVVNESAVIRWDYGDAVLGTCKESIEGGNHFRYWIQNGDKANTCVSPSPSPILVLGLMGDAWVAVLCLWLRRTRNLQQVRCDSRRLWSVNKLTGVCYLLESHNVPPNG